MNKLLKLIPLCVACLYPSVAMAQWGNVCSLGTAVLHYVIIFELLSTLLLLIPYFFYGKHQYTLDSFKRPEKIAPIIVIPAILNILIDVFCFSMTMGPPSCFFDSNHPTLGLSVIVWIVIVVKLVLFIRIDVKIYKLRY